MRAEKLACFWEESARTVADSCDDEDMFKDFDKRIVPVEGAEICTRAAGEGPAVLLIHGYPQTSAMWHALAPRLAMKHRVVVCDLRGYGQSRALDGDFSFRAMANDMVSVMQRLGIDRFHVIGHDRGARTAHRMVLDHPQVVASLTLLDILPTLKVWELMDAWLGQRYYHWLFLAQSPPLPQAMISRAPVEYLHAALGGLSGPLSIFDPEALAAYEAAARNPEVVAAWCADYAAAASVDIAHDRADLGRTSDVNTLVLWGGKGVVGAQVDPIQTWREWFPLATGREIDAGHFIVEEALEDVCAELMPHLRRES